MAFKFPKVKTIDLIHAPQNSRGEYIITTFIEGMDYIVGDRAIWSIGKHKQTGEILAALDGRFYQNPCYECVWLR